LEKYNEKFNKTGIYPNKGIEHFRDKVCPVLSNSASGKEEAYKIDFSSDKKFNCLIRDMNP
jgi:hypothetical protein